MSGWRDRALLLVGFSGAFRRSEWVGLNVEDVARVEVLWPLILVGMGAGPAVHKVTAS